MILQMGRPREENPNTINLTVRINAQLNERLIAYCAKQKLSKGEVVRQGIESILGNDMFAKRSSP